MMLALGSSIWGFNQSCWYLVHAEVLADVQCRRRAGCGQGFPCVITVSHCDSSAKQVAGNKHLP
jgi:hypothetical protein